MIDDGVWIKAIVYRVKPELEEVCPYFSLEELCNTVLDCIGIAFPRWFEGKKARTIAGTVLYISMLIARGPQRGTLKKVLESVGVSKPSIREAVSRLVVVDWDLGVVYLSPRLYSILSKRVALPPYVVPYTREEVVRVRLRKSMPGIYEFLETQCRRVLAKDCVEILFEDPAVLRNIIVERYSVPLVAKRVAERFLAPVGEALGLDITPKKLAELLIENPEELKRLLSEV